MSTEFPSADLDRLIAKYYPRKSPPWAPELRLERDLGGDSLSLVELVMSIEENLGVTLPDHDVGLIETVGELRALVRERWEKA